MHQPAVAAELGAVIMVGGGVPDSLPTTPHGLMLAAQRASALDLVDLLADQGVGRIVLAAPTTEWLPGDSPAIPADDPPGQSFHFGDRLAALVDQFAVDPLLYFGGGSAPLVNAAVAGMLINLITSAADPRQRGIPSHIVLTNNLHSSDWAAISHARDALPIVRTLYRDNSLAWLLKQSGEYDVRVLSGIRPASSMDIDTPSDLALLALHPEVQPRLRGVLQLSADLLARVPVSALLDTVMTEAKTLAIFGRVSPPAWQALGKVSRVWTRVVAEERGMVASERVERGEVRSVLSPWLAARGFDGFFADLAGMADAALFDTRVLFAAQGIHPDEADRFAADLFLHELIRDPWLREFTRAAAHASIPIVMGGHSVVSGGLHVLSEIIQARQAG